MKIWFDTEFIEDGHTIELISIGMVDAHSKELYLCNSECDLTRAGDWVQKNVIPKLPSPGSAEWVTQEEIKRAILKYVGYPYYQRGVPEFWAYFSSYDWVVFCRLFGRMVDLPQGFPQYCHDLKQEADRLGDPQFKSPGGVHNALEDARWNKRFYDFLKLRA